MSLIVNNSYSFSEMASSMEEEVLNSLIGRHVVWIQKPRHELAQILVVALVTLEVLVLSLSLVGFIVLEKAWANIKILDDCQELKKREKTGSPPEQIKVETETKLRTFNHHSYFVIHDEMIWCKLKTAEDSIWKPIYFDGYIKGQMPIEIQADGANLVVTDDQGNYHYKKVLEEKRDYLERYSFKDLSTKNNWKDRWFTFPLVHKIYHIFGEKILKIPEGAKGWALSHRGEYNNYFEDKQNKKHNTFAMVTSIYVLTAEGKIIYADPYLMNKFGNTLEGPHPDFIGEMISASSSTPFIFGFLNGEPKLYTILADFDTRGKNPALSGFWNKNSRSDPNWKEHALPKETNEILSIAIFQTGEGNAARRLQLTTSQGILEKNILEEKWQWN